MKVGKGEHKLKTAAFDIVITDASKKAYVISAETAEIRNRWSEAIQLAIDAAAARTANSSEATSSEAAPPQPVTTAAPPSAPAAPAESYLVDPPATWAGIEEVRILGQTQRQNIDKLIMSSGLQEAASFSVGSHDAEIASKLLESWSRDAPHRVIQSILSSMLSSKAPIFEPLSSCFARLLEIEERISEEFADDCHLSDAARAAALLAMQVEAGQKQPPPPPPTTASPSERRMQRRTQRTGEEEAVAVVISPNRQSPKSKSKSMSMSPSLARSKKNESTPKRKKDHYHYEGRPDWSQITSPDGSIIYSSPKSEVVRRASKSSIPFSKRASLGRPPPKTIGSRKRASVGGQLNDAPAKPMAPWDTSISSKSKKSPNKPTSRAEMGLFNSIYSTLREDFEQSESHPTLIEGSRTQISSASSRKNNTPRTNANLPKQQTNESVEVKIALHRGMDLKTRNEAEDFYCKIVPVGIDGERLKGLAQKTKPQLQTCNPIWREEVFTFSVDPSEIDNFSCVIKDWNRHCNSQALGTFSIPVSDVISAQSQEEEVLIALDGDSSGIVIVSYGRVLAEPGTSTSAVTPTDTKEKAEAPNEIITNDGDDDGDDNDNDGDESNDDNNDDNDNDDNNDDTDGDNDENDVLKGSSTDDDDDGDDDLLNISSSDIIEASSPHSPPACSRQGFNAKKLSDSQGKPILHDEGEGGAEFDYPHSIPTRGETSGPAKSETTSRITNVRKNTNLKVSARAGRKPPLLSASMSSSSKGRCWGSRVGASPDKAATRAFQVSMGKRLLRTTPGRMETSPTQPRPLPRSEQTSASRAAAKVRGVSPSRDKSGKRKKESAYKKSNASGSNIKTANSASTKKATSKSSKRAETMWQKKFKQNGKSKSFFDLYPNVASRSTAGIAENAQWERAVGWLKSINMEQYESVFKEQGMTSLSAIELLEEKDLTEMKVRLSARWREKTLASRFYHGAIFS